MSRALVAPVQIGPAVLVQDAETLRHLYFCMKAGIQKCSRDGVSPAPLHPLAVLIRRAYMSASGHKHPVFVLAEEHSTSWDNDWLSVGEAATELGLGERQVRRLAKAGLGTRKGREWRLLRSKVLELKAERDWKARNGSRHAPRAVEEAVGLAIDSYIAALTDDQVDALLARTRPPKSERPGAETSRAYGLLGPASGN